MRSRGRHDGFLLHQRGEGGEEDKHDASSPPLLSIKEVTKRMESLSNIDHALIFDLQISKLEKRTPYWVAEPLRALRSSVLLKAGLMEIGEGQTPFLPIVPMSCLDIAAQMLVIRNDGKQGTVAIDPSLIEDLVATPAKPYYLFDIGNGKETKHIPPLRAEELLKEQGRRGLTVTEVIALCIHTPVLWRHQVCAVGSRYASDMVPMIQLSSDDVPLLCSWSAHEDRQTCGTASCRLIE